mmetsp:Transcript_66891/g.216200  ORF Transcript_66891/g.216200 Transcript_66891/m.216200 type:complete len:80 (-) Transcript_66891:319-558(-)
MQCYARWLQTILRLIALRAHARKNLAVHKGKRKRIAASQFRWHDRLGFFLLLIVVTSLVEGASYFYNVAPIIVSLGLAS